MYYVYYGHIHCDNHEYAPTWKIQPLVNQKEVLEFYEKWLSNNDHEDCLKCTFRVFKGDELDLTPCEKIVSYRLEERVQ